MKRYFAKPCPRELASAAQSKQARASQGPVKQVEVPAAHSASQRRSHPVADKHVTTDGRATHHLGQWQGVLTVIRDNVVSCKTQSNLRLLLSPVLSFHLYALYFPISRVATPIFLSVFGVGPSVEATTASSAAFWWCGRRPSQSPLSPAQHYRLSASSRHTSSQHNKYFLYKHNSSSCKLSTFLTRFISTSLPRPRFISHLNSSSTLSLLALYSAREIHFGRTRLWRTRSASARHVHDARLPNLTRERNHSYHFNFSPGFFN